MEEPKTPDKIPPRDPKITLLARMLLVAAVASIFVNVMILRTLRAIGEANTTRSVIICKIGLAQGVELPECQRWVP